VLILPARFCASHMQQGVPDNRVARTQGGVQEAGGAEQGGKHVQRYCQLVGSP